MKRSLAILVFAGAGVAPAAADIPVIDKTNYAVARDTAEKTVLVDAPSDAGRAKIGVPTFASS